MTSYSSSSFLFFLFVLLFSFESVCVLVSGTYGYTSSSWSLSDCPSGGKYCCGSGSTASTLTVTTSAWTTVKLDSDYVCQEYINVAIAWKGFRGDRLTVQCPPGYAVPSGQNVYAQCDSGKKGWSVRTSTGSLIATTSGVLGSCQPELALTTVGPFPSSSAGKVQLSWTDSTSQILNSFISTSTFRGYHNDRITITCNNGYTLNGPSSTRCDNNRINPPGWNSNEVAKCTPTPAIGCPTQLRLSPAAVATTRLKIAVSDSGVKYSVNTVISYGNGYYTGRVGEQVSVTCATDCQYGTSSPSTATCTSSGWSTPPVCLPKACYNRIPITAAGTGIVNLTKTYADQEDIGAIDPPATFQGYVGDEVQLICAPGFKNNGPTTAKCSAGTTGWGSDCALGSCVPDVCPNTVTIPSLLKGVTTIVSTYWNGNDTGVILGSPTTPGTPSSFKGRVGDIISLRCNAGLTLSGSGTATCTSTGWTPLGSCILACTGTLYAPTNGYITIDQFANSTNPTKYSSVVNPDNSHQYYVGCNDPNSYNIEYHPKQPIVFPTTYPGGNPAYAFGVHWDFGTAAYKTFKLKTDGSGNIASPLVASVKEGAVNPTPTVGGVMFADSSTIGAPKINLTAWGFKTRTSGSSIVYQPMVPYSPGPVPLSGPGSYSWVTANAGNFDSSSPPAWHISLALKEEGAGETGLGLTGHGQLEIMRDQWITFDLKPLRDAGFGAVNFGIESVQLKEGYAIWGSQKLGSPGQLLYVGTSELGVSSQYIVADDVPSATAPYRYISVSTQGYMSGSTMSWSNVLISPVAARGITSCEVPILLECSKKGNSGVVGDPQFSGLQGQSFQFHGIPDEVFNLISTPSLQVNSHFKYISAGTCTYAETQCWTHPGTYLDEIGLMIGSGVRVHVVSGAHAHGLRVFIDGEEKYAETDLMIDLAEDANVTTAIVKFTKQNAVTIITDLFDIELVNSDYFFNLGVVLKNRHIVSAGRPRRVIPSRVCKAEAAVRASHSESHSHENSPVRHDLLHHYPDLPIHGLVGQTWKNAVYCGASFEGSVDDYVAGSLWGTDFTFNQYTVDADRLMPQSEQENQAQLHHI